MCHRYFYRAIPCTIAFLIVLDAMLWLSRLLLFNIPASYSTENTTSTFPSPFYSSNQAFAALAFDCIGSALSIVLVVYLALSIGIYAVVITPILFVEQCSSDPKKKTRMTSSQLCIANLRFVTLTCNCPCYTPRPELRFYVRLGTLLFFLLMRTISMILYATLNVNSILSTVIAIISGIATLVIYLTAALDYYRYRMWCYYRPEGIYKPCQMWCCAQKYHPGHLQFLPAPLLGTNRDPDQLGNQPCRNQSDSCNELTLQHIAIFHSFDFKPQKRYDPCIHKTYFGFHQTTIDAAIGISQTGFRISDTPPQMLGFGVYFARSFAGTEGKARRKGKCHVLYEHFKTNVNLIYRSVDLS